MSARRAWLKWVLLLAGIALAVHVLLPAVVGFGRTRRALESMTWWLVVVAALAEVCSYFGSGVLIQGLVRLGGGTVGIARGAALTLASGAVGTISAGIVGSSVSMYEWIRHGPKPSEGGWTAAGLKPAFNLAVVLAIGSYGIVHLLVRGGLTRQETLMLGLLVLGLAGISSTLVRLATHPESFRATLGKLERRWARFRGKPSRPERIDHLLRRIGDAWSMLRRGRWKQPLLGAALNVGFDVLCLYLLFLAAGVRMPVGQLLVGYSLPILLGKASFIPGGAGVVELSMTAAFTQAGAPPGTVTVVVLAYRLMAFWLPTLIGFLLAARLQRHASATS